MLDFDIFELGKADANTCLPQQPQHSSSSDAPPAKRPHTELEPSWPSSQEDRKLSMRSLRKTVYRSRVIEKRPEVLKLPTPGKLFINLAFIDRKMEGLWKRDGGSRTEYDEITEAMVRDGNVDVIEGRKCPIDMNNIAANLPETALEKVILVEGAPGVGKSTFAWEVCRRSPSLFLELINGQLLPFATLMITSRPWATCDVLEPSLVSADRGLGVHKGADNFLHSQCTSGK